MTNSEEAFRAILDAADRAGVVTTEIHLKDLDPLSLESYPDRTAIRLERDATLLFRSGILLLREPELSYAAEVLQRGILELAGQMFRIYGMQRSSLVSRRRRAICFEYGSMRGLYESIYPVRRKGRRPEPLSRKGFATKEGRASTRQRYRDIADLHSKTCPTGCNGTSYSNISSTLVQMSRRHRELRWVEPMYAIGSMAAHGTLARALAAADQTTLAPVPMSLEERMAFLDRLLVAYGITIEFAGRTHMPALGEFQRVALALKQALTHLRSEMSETHGSGNAPL